MKKQIIEKYLLHSVFALYREKFAFIAHGLSIALTILGVSEKYLAYMELEAKTWAEKNCPGFPLNCIPGCDRCEAWAKKECENWNGGKS